MKRDWTKESDDYIDGPEGRQVFTKFCELALRTKRRGKHAGAKSLCEYIRWNLYFEGIAAEPWKINNNYITRIAQRAVMLLPELEGFFKFRSVFKKIEEQKELGL